MNLTEIVKSIVPFKKEKYLPIINRNGRVLGKIAFGRCRALRDSAPFTIPVVRIIMLNGSRFLLNERHIDVLNSSGKTDTPFERYVLFREEIDSAAQRTLHETGMDADTPVRFLCHYHYHTQEANRLVYLYLCNIRNKKTFEKITHKSGSWWPVRKICENLHSGLFPEYFEKEFELIRTVQTK
jgi:hypothetical protein